jgi:hypothetical protein
MISPFGNVTVLPEARWNPEPTTRGTFSILSSCLITMTLCIWTAVHLNLPEHGKESEKFKRKTWWLMLGLLAPEVVVWNAWSQRARMKGLNRSMRKAGFMAEEIKMQQQVRAWFGKASAGVRLFFSLRVRTSPALAGSYNRRELYHGRTNPWTDVHSWYAVMGGLAFEDTAAEEHQFMPGG